MSHRTTARFVGSKSNLGLKCCIDLHCAISYQIVSCMFGTSISKTTNPSSEQLQVLQTPTNPGMLLCNAGELQCPHIHMHRVACTDLLLTGKASYKHHPVSGHTSPVGVGAAGFHCPLAHRAVRGAWVLPVCLSGCMSLHAAS